MRIGTWNLEGRWTEGHRKLLDSASCDVWLLTEVPSAFALGRGHLVRSAAMPGRRGRTWSAVWTAGECRAITSPHPAAAAVHFDGHVACSCVLPWRGAAPYWPDRVPGVAAMTIAALDRLRLVVVRTDRPVIWGGDWNHAMAGPEYAGTRAGRAAIARVVQAADLVISTAGAPHRIEGLLSIDHIALPSTWGATESVRLAAMGSRGRLSDHDAYVVTIDR